MSVRLFLSLQTFTKQTISGDICSTSGYSGYIFPYFTPTRSIYIYIYIYTFRESMSLGNFGIPLLQRRCDTLCDISCDGIERRANASLSGFFRVSMRKCSDTSRVPWTSTTDGTAKMTSAPVVVAVATVNGSTQRSESSRSVNAKSESGPVACRWSAMSSETSVCDVIKDATVLAWSAEAK